MRLTVDFDPVHVYDPSVRGMYSQLRLIDQGRPPGVNGTNGEDAAIGDSQVRACKGERDIIWSVRVRCENVV